MELEYKRRRNEREYPNWETLPGGGRRYWKERGGSLGWRVRYVKEVDSQEITEGFVQEIYDETGRLAEIHQKYPVDTGHQKLY